MEHHLCDECETASHCHRNGCIGYEAADTRRIQEQESRWTSAVQLVGEEPAPARAIDWQAVWLWGAVVACFTAVIALSIYRP